MFMYAYANVSSISNNLSYDSSSVVCSNAERSPGKAHFFIPFDVYYLFLCIFNLTNYSKYCLKHVFMAILNPQNSSVHHYLSLIYNYEV